MEFDIVIVTRNRKAALELSLPLMLNQSRLPVSLIVVDASDDHASVKAAVERIAASCPNGSNVELRILESPVGLTVQRNVGLCHVKSPVVFFPDDDALWFPGLSESVMRVYEADVNGSIGAVCPSESATPPVRIWGNSSVKHRMTLLDRFKFFYDRHFERIESSFYPDPLLTAGNSAWGGREMPAQYNDGDVEICGSMTGFRMTFRTDLIRSLGGFDESLGAYALFEDRDASLRVLKTHMILCAKAGRVFHHRSPEKRTSGREFGIMNILNRAYIICKNFGPEPKVRNELQRFLAFKVLRYALQSYSRYGRERLIGAWRAYRLVHQLYETAGSKLTERYLALKYECLHLCENRPHSLA